MTPVRPEPAALRSRVKHSTTEPLHSHQSFDLSGDPREGWVSFNDLSGDALISQLIMFVCKVWPELFNSFPMMLR